MSTGTRGRSDDTDAVRGREHTHKRDSASRAPGETLQRALRAVNRCRRPAHRARRGELDPRRGLPLAARARRPVRRLRHARARGHAAAALRHRGAPSGVVPELGAFARRRAGRPRTRRAGGDPCA
ncbi:hypothetical protein ACRAWF_10030 [Streptomyces sp. L7]